MTPKERNQFKKFMGRYWYVWGLPLYMNFIIGIPLWATAADDEISTGNAFLFGGLLPWLIISTLYLLYRAITWAIVTANNTILRARFKDD